MERLYSTRNMRYRSVEIGGGLVFAVFVYPFLDEYLFQRRRLQLFVQFVQDYRQLGTDDAACGVYAMTQNVADSQEARFAIADYAAVGRYVDFAVGKCIERVDGLVGRRARLKMNEYRRLRRCVVLYLADLYLTLVVGLEDGFYQRICRLAEWQLRDIQRLGVNFLDFCAYLQRAAAASVVVARHVDEAARGKIGIESELLVADARYRRIDDLVEIMRQYLRRKTHGYALRTLREQQRVLGGQRHRLALAAVVAHGPLRNLLVVKHLHGESRQSGLDVTAGGCRGSRQYVAPVALRLNEQIFLTQLHQRILDRRIAVWMVLHGDTHYVGNLVEMPVVDGFHRVEYTSLNGLEAVVDIRHRTLQNYIRGIFQKPCLVHAAQMVAHYILAVGIRPHGSDGFTVEVNAVAFCAVVFSAVACGGRLVVAGSQVVAGRRYVLAARRGACGIVDI